MVKLQRHCHGATASIHRFHSRHPRRWRVDVRLVRQGSFGGSGPRAGQAGHSGGGVPDDSNLEARIAWLQVAFVFRAPLLDSSVNVIEHIKANAELTIQQLRPLSEVEFGYTTESVEWLQRYIERLRGFGEFEDEASKETLTSVFGSFLGECIVYCCGGVWTNRDEVWCVGFGGENFAYPFAKVRKQIENGPEDGIGGFFRAIPAVFPGRVRSTEEALRVVRVFGDFPGPPAAEPVTGSKAIENHGGNSG